MTAMHQERRAARLDTYRGWGLEPGCPQSALPTPALLLDLDLLEANVAAMAGWCRQQGIALRPHAKTHKSADIARLQLRHGAAGICCAKLEEAESLHAQGIDDILITSPQVTDAQHRRLAGLAAGGAAVRAVVDDAEVAARLDREVRRQGATLQVLLDLDVGTHRTGVPCDQRADAAADAIAGLPGLQLVGVQAYAGHLMHLEGHENRRAACQEVNEMLLTLLQRLHGSHEIACVSGGGTGTWNLDGGAEPWTELQAGSYVFMDRWYRDVMDAEGEPPHPFADALSLLATVISSPKRRLPVTDAGFKVLATDAGVPGILEGAPDGSSYVFMGDEQGAVLLPEGHSLPIGAQVRCQVPHCDPTVNLHDFYHCVRGGVWVDLWPVHARGASA